MSWPLKLIPPVLEIRRKSARPSVVLPEPLSPTTPTVWPSRMSKVMPSTALTWPTVRFNSPRWIGKCTLTSAARTTLAAVSSASGGAPLGSAASRCLV